MLYLALSELLAAGKVNKKMPEQATYKANRARGGVDTGGEQLPPLLASTQGDANIFLGDGKLSNRFSFKKQ